MRCMHEAQMHEENSFVTLTFDEENLQKRPEPWNLDVTEFQRFMKRLRKARAPQKIRFYHCGEYGEKNGRPHYHAILFGCAWPDREVYSIKNGNKIYISQELQKLWPYGFSTIGECTFETAAYTARYCMKKITGDAAEDHYKVVDPYTGEVIGQKRPEYATMSRRPGIGKTWYDRYKTDVYPKDFVTLNGVKMAPPEYYDRLLQSDDELTHDAIKAERAKFCPKRAENSTTERLSVREKVLLNKTKNLKREL